MPFRAFGDSDRFLVLGNRVYDRVSFNALSGIRGF